MIFLFSSGSATPASASRKRAESVDAIDLDAGFREKVRMTPALVLPAAAGVDEDAAQPVADGAVDQGGSHRRIHPPESPSSTSSFPTSRRIFSTASPR